MIDTPRGIFDITVAISPRMPIFPGDPPVELDPALQIPSGDPANVSRCCLGTHTGTHIDPPCHFIPGGSSVDEIPLDALVGPAVVIGLERVRGGIRAADLQAAGIPGNSRRVLLRTSNSAWWADPEHAFHEDYVYLDLDGARWLVDRGVRLVGIDYLSIEALHSTGHPVHRSLLAAGVIVVEGLDLSSALPGAYHLVCLPWKLKRGDGGPARAILVRF